MAREVTTMVETVPTGPDKTLQRRKYGGFNVGAAFFGWLVSVGMAALLTALLSAIGSAIVFTAPVATANLTEEIETIGVVSGALLLAALALSYYAGGYVAGRMSRFDGGRQGFGVWLMGLLTTVLLAMLGVVFGTNYNLLGQVNLPRIPISEGDVTRGGLITLIIIVAVTALAAVAGGKYGQLYHSKVDRAGEP